MDSIVISSYFIIRSTELNIMRLVIVVVVSSPHRSPRCGVSVGAVHSDSTVSVVSFDIAGTLKQKVGVALPTSAAPPPKRQFDE